MKMSDENNNIPVFTDGKFEPCKVCGEQSSGWHCGAITCEACKKFFLRSINGEDAKYKCVRNQDCVIVRSTRTQCQYCRFQKCKEVGMTINENPANPTIAEIFKSFQCSVCSAPASGYHFGAVTCEGCKGFFRRSIKERAPERYRCMESGECEISVATRNMCRYCRFQRCLKAGMSSQNSRIGRQSNLFKHHVLEWQSKGFQPNAQLLAQRKMKRVKSESTMSTKTGHNEHETNKLSQLVPCSSGSMLNLNPNPAVAPHQLLTSGEQYSDYTINPQMLDPNANYNLNNAYTTNNYYNSNNGNTWPNAQVIDVNIRLPIISATTTNSNKQANTSTNTATQQTCIEDSLEDSIKCLIKVVHQAYNEYLGSIVDTINEDLKRTGHFSIQRQNNLNYQGSMSFQQQQQQNSLFDEIMKYFSFYSKKLISFSQHIPEFSKLSISDKEELVRGSVHSVMLLALQRRCDNQNYFNCDLAKFERIVKKLPKFAFTALFMKTIHEKFEKYKLDDKEYALYSALLVISAASRHLEDYDKITEMRENIGTALRRYMFARRNEEITCDEILLMQIHFRKTNHLLQNEIVAFHNKSIEADIEAFKEHQFIYRVFFPNNKIIIN